MLIKCVVLGFLFLLTGCIKPLSDRVEEQPATAYEALQSNPTLAAVQNAWPKPQIMRRPANGDAPQLLLDNAGQVALATVNR